MAGVEDLLREELRTNAPTLPGRDALLSRVRRARRRRVAGAGIAGAAVVVAAAVTAISIVPSGSAGQQFAGANPRQYRGELINTIFTDPQHGYAVQQGCSMDVPGPVPDDAPTPDIHEQCTTQLLATSDGGQTWQTRAVPGEPATKDAGVDIIQGRSLMLWIDPSGQLAYGGWNRRYWTTGDGGLTWHESPTPRDIGPTPSYGTFGAGDTLTFLQSPPPAGVGFPKSVVRAADGSYWLAVTVQKERGKVTVSRDNGATWQTLSTLASEQWVDWVSTADGQTVYASVRTSTGSRLARSTNGGATWSEVLPLAQAGWLGLTLANGDVLLAENTQNGGMFRLRAGTTTLEPLAGAPAHPQVLYVSGGVIVAAQAWDEQQQPALDSIASVSFDGGTTWVAVPAPAVS